MESRRGQDDRMATAFANSTVYNIQYITQKNKNDSILKYIELNDCSNSFHIGITFYSIVSPGKQVVDAKLYVYNDRRSCV
jgi:hypothetical protein